MSEKQIHGHAFVPFISQESIENKVNELAALLNKKFEDIDEPPLVLGILNGSFIFMADLLRALEFPCTVQFIRIESYQGLKTTGVVKMESELSHKWINKHVIVVEDIVDTGQTLHRFVPVLKSYEPKSVFVTALLYKEEALEVDVQLDHYCFKIPKEFVVGYGLDYDGLGRNLKDIYKLK